MNDNHYVEAAVTDYFNLNLKGPYWIQRKLLEKGLDKDVIERKYCEDLYWRSNDRNVV